MSLDGKMRISEAYSLLSDLLIAPQIGVPFVKGQPGVGKSQILVDICFDLYHTYPHLKKCAGCDKGSGSPLDHEKGCPAWHEAGAVHCDICKSHAQNRLHRTYGPHVRLRDIRLSNFDPIEVKGLSGGVERDGRNVTVVFTPEWIPSHPEEYSVLFFDEFNLACKPTQDSALQIVHDRRVHDTILSPRCTIACAGNRESDGANITRLSGPLNNRLCHIEVELNVDDWVDYAKRKGIRPEIIGAVEYNSSGMLPEFSREKVAQPTPRTLEKLSAMIERAAQMAKSKKPLKEGEQESISVEDATWRRFGVPTIGNAATTELVAFIGLYESVSPAEIVLEGKMPTYTANDLDRMFASQCAVANYITRAWDDARGESKEAKATLRKILSKAGCKNIFDFLEILSIDLRVKFQGDLELTKRIGICSAFVDHESERFQAISDRMAGAIN